MSQNNYTEVTRKSWLSRIASSIMGVVFGLIFFVLSFPLLIWNENRAIERVLTLEEGAGSVTSISSNKVSSINNKKLVHLTAETLTNEVLADSVFGIEVNAIKLKRNVEVYQWQENVKTRKEKELGGGEKTIKDYSYSKTWSNRVINSDNFKDSTHQNPTQFVYNQKTYTAKNVTFGAFVFPEALINRMNQFIFVQPDPNNLPAIENIKIYSDGYYIGKDIDNPEVGDIKINFQIVEPVIVSIVAQQVEDTFEPYISGNGGRILLLEYGAISQGNMFHSAHKDNRTLTWILRVVGLVIMIIGLALILKPLSVLADVIPILGTIVGAGTTTIAILSAMILTFITIAITWLVLRPLIGGGLLLLAVGLLWLMKRKISNSKPTNSLSEA